MTVICFLFSCLPCVCLKLCDLQLVVFDLFILKGLTGLTIWRVTKVIPNHKHRVPCNSMPHLVLGCQLWGSQQETIKSRCHNQFKHLLGNLQYQLSIAQSRSFNIELITWMQNVTSMGCDLKMFQPYSTWVWLMKIPSRRFASPKQLPTSSHGLLSRCVMYT